MIEMKNFLIWYLSKGWRAARGRDEIRAANMGTPHQTDDWVRGWQKSFFESE